MLALLLRALSRAQRIDLPEELECLQNSIVRFPCDLDFYMLASVQLLLINYYA